MYRVTEPFLRKLKSDMSTQKPPEHLANASYFQGVNEAIEVTDNGRCPSAHWTAFSTRWTRASGNSTNEHGPVSYSERKEVDLLQKFDMNPRFGPHVGISRLSRWIRAEQSGLQPPFPVLALINEHTERILREFDLNPLYGPYTGIDRLSRWKRAKEFGIKAPEMVRCLLDGICISHGQRTHPKTFRFLRNAQISLGVPEMLNTTHPIHPLNRIPGDALAKSVPSQVSEGNSSLSKANKTHHCGRDIYLNFAAVSDRHNVINIDLTELGSIPCTLEDNKTFKKVKSCHSGVRSQSPSVSDTFFEVLKPASQLPVAVSSSDDTRPNERNLSLEEEQMQSKFGLNLSCGPFVGRRGFSRRQRSKNQVLKPPIAVHRIIEKREMLRTFDLNPRYGPFSGIDRLERWERAKKFGLQPLEEIRWSIEESCNGYTMRLEKDRATKSIPQLRRKCDVFTGPARNRITVPKEAKVNPALLPSKQLKLVSIVKKGKKVQRLRSVKKTQCDLKIYNATTLGNLEKSGESNCLTGSTLDGSLTSSSEEILHQFDLNTSFGPSTGIDRLGRWHRAAKSDLNPPVSILNLLKAETSKLLRLFDLNPQYGPFLGTDRLERWNRAKEFGLNPPQALRLILEQDSNPSYAQADSFAMRITHRYPRPAAPMPQRMEES